MVLPSHIPPLAWGQACAFWAGGVLFWCRGSAYLFADLRASALIKREGGTAKVPPSHIPFLAVVSGGAVSGFWGGRWGKIFC